MSTVHAHVGVAQSRLVGAGLEPDQAGVDAEVLARDVLGWDRATYLSRGRMVAPDDFGKRYDTLVARRERREPVSHISGHREFWGLEFEVTSDVLSPRPETELLVEEALSRLGQRESHRARIVDVGTGTACVAVSVAREAPDCQITAVDVSTRALAVGKRNAVRHGVADRIRWVCASLLTGVTQTGDLRLILANLPYIPESDIASLPPEVREYEPRVALAGGVDGLDKIRTLVDEAGAHLCRGGSLLLECGADQSESLCRHVLTTDGLEVVDVRADLQGIPRMVVVEKR